MGRLIEAETLMKEMYHRAFETDDDTMWQSGCWVRYRAVGQTVRAQPTVDAVPVVRCKDCRFSTWYDAADGVKRCFCDSHGSAGHTETDFCSYAEREETD